MATPGVKMGTLQSLPVDIIQQDLTNPRISKFLEPYGEEGKYKLIFAEPAKPIGPIPFADAPLGSMQGPRYTTFAKLQKAKKLMDVF